LRCSTCLHPMQGIEHVVMPEMGLIQPGIVIAEGR